VQTLLGPDLLEDRVQLLLEVGLQLVLHFLQLGVGVLLKELDVTVQLLDVLLELTPRGFVQDLPALLQLRLQCLELFVLLTELRGLLLAELIEPRAGGLSFDRVRRDSLDVHVGDLRALRKRLGRLRRGSGLLRRRRCRGRLLLWRLLLRWLLLGGRRLRQRAAGRQQQAHDPEDHRRLEHSHVESPFQLRKNNAL
jgi:hypothetical protein